MNKKSMLLRIAVTALISAVMASSVAMTLMRAAGLSVSWLWSCAPALIAAALCGIMSISSLAAIFVLGGAALAGGACVILNMPAYQAVRGLFAALAAISEGFSAETFLGLEGAIAAIVAALYALFCFAMLSGSGRGETGLAVLATALIIISANVLSETSSLIYALPALIACVAAYARTAELQREGGFLRALVPAVLAVLLAFLLMPQANLTFGPLESAANRVRDIFDDYFRFTQERVAFSINEQGYNYALEIGGQPTALLGGPAHPDTREVMRVQTDTDVLLRGSIRRTYTGYSWTDDMEKARYLYFDFSRRAVRERTFGVNLLSGLDLSEAFKGVDISVEMLTDGTSTLFVPGKLTAFDFPLDTASYYNSIGEVFISRNVAAGDRYSAKGVTIDSFSALQAAADQAALVKDGEYQDMLAMYTALPSTVEQGVYSLVTRLTEGLDTPYERAMAIQDYLQANFAYTLEVEYPPTNRDFVAYFLLESNQGYCSYFASAMAVMCRIAGIPARYIEGYYAQPDENGVAVITGEDAHAWVELYFSGLGWVEFDATPGADQSHGDGDSDGDDQGDLPDDPPDETDEPTLPPDSPDGEPTPSPDPGDNPFDEPELTQPPDGYEALNDPQEGRDFRWLWFAAIGLLLLLIIALIVMWARRRLERADPAKLCARESSAERAAMILYRSILTLLAHMGHVPLSGETPEAFAARLSKTGLENPAFAGFVSQVSMNRYAGEKVTADMLEEGLCAYAVYYQKLNKIERASFAARRIFGGLGDFDAIP